MNLPVIAADKATHLIVNILAIQLGVTVGLLIQAPLLTSVALGLVLAIALSVWKELVHDKLQRKGEASWKDMAANAAGMVIGLWPWALVYAKGIL
jgi:hypothetical protein